MTWILCTFAGITLTALIIGFWRKPVEENIPADSTTTTTQTDDNGTLTPSAVATAAQAQ